MGSPDARPFLSRYAAAIAHLLRWRRREPVIGEQLPPPDLPVSHPPQAENAPDAIFQVSGWRFVLPRALEEMVRFSITVAYPEEGGSGTGMVYRILDPTWYDAATS